MYEKKNGNLIKIIDEYTVAIDLGRKHGIRNGDILIIYEESDDILDLEKKKKLGTLKLKKGEIIVTHSYDEYSICKSNEKEIIRSVFSASTSPLAERTENKPLNVNREQNDNLSIKNPLISLGDPVILKKEF